MGSGKSTVGRLLAQQIGWHFADLDQQIELRAGMTIPAIFERMGEPAFREIESEELARILGVAVEARRATVIALGGGTYAQPVNLAALRQAGGSAVWLDCTVDVLLHRCAGIMNRPLFRDEASFRQLYEARLPFYQMAEYRVAGDAEPRLVVEQILALEFFEPAGALGRGGRV